MIKLKELLLEKTFKISADVDYIYKAGGFEKFIKAFKKDNRKFPESNKIKRETPIQFVVIKSDNLKSIDAKKANLVNPVRIFCGIYTNGSFYRPTTNVIQISLHYNALSMYANHMEHTVPDSQLKRLKNEITEHKIKSSISHELSHWISDSLYNSHIGKLVNKASEFNNTAILKLGKQNVNMTYFEIDAQIHGIKELKRKHESEWDNLTLFDVYTKYTPLGSTAKVLWDNYGQDILDIWQTSLVKRMAREKLLGKNMKTFVKGSIL